MATAPATSNQGVRAFFADFTCVGTTNPSSFLANKHACSARGRVSSAPPWVSSGSRPRKSATAELASSKTACMRDDGHDRREWATSASLCIKAATLTYEMRSASRENCFSQFLPAQRQRTRRDDAGERPTTASSCRACRHLSGPGLRCAKRVMLAMPMSFALGAPCQKQRVDASSMTATSKNIG